MGCSPYDSKSTYDFQAAIALKALGRWSYDTPIHPGRNSYFNDAYLQQRGLERRFNGGEPLTI
jgi:hypothetical protein